MLACWRRNGQWSQGVVRLDVMCRPPTDDATAMTDCASARALKHWNNTWESHCHAESAESWYSSAASVLANG